MQARTHDGGGTDGSHPLIFADLFAAARNGSIQWEPFRGGIDICRIYQQSGAGSAAFLRYAPGARLQRHSHDGYEHVFVLSGSQSDENGEHHAGAMIVNPPGSAHTVHAPQGCVVLVIWEKPVVFLSE